MGKKRQTAASPAAEAAPSPPALAAQGTKKVSPREGRGKGSVESAEAVNVDEMLRLKIAELEVMERRRNDGDWLEKELKSAEPVPLDEATALAPFLAIIEGDGDPEEKKSKAAELQGKEAAEVKRLKETCSMLTKACQSLRNRAREQTAEAEALRVEAEKKRDVQARLQELCRAQAQQCKATKADNERILTAEEENRQTLEDQFQKMLADVKDAVDAQAKRGEERLAENQRLEERLKEVLALKEAKAEQIKTHRADREADVHKFKQSVENQGLLLKEEQGRTELLQRQLRHYEQKLAAVTEQADIYAQRVDEYESHCVRSRGIAKQIEERIEVLEATKLRLSQETAMLKDAVASKTAEQQRASEELKAAKPRLEEALAAKVKLERACRQLQAERMERLAASKKRQEEEREAESSSEEQLQQGTSAGKHTADG